MHSNSLKSVPKLKLSSFKNHKLLGGLLTHWPHYHLNHWTYAIHSFPGQCLFSSTWTFLSFMWLTFIFNKFAFLCSSHKYQSASSYYHAQKELSMYLQYMLGTWHSYNCVWPLSVNFILLMDILQLHSFSYRQSSYVAIDGQIYLSRWWIFGCQSHLITSDCLLTFPLYVC